jgi:hypothetical protein
MSPAFRNSSLIQHDDFIAVSNCAQAMRNDNARAAASAYIILDNLFRDGVERRCCFVEHNERRIGNQCSSDFDPLALATAEINSTLGDVAIVISWS